MKKIFTLLFLVGYAIQSHSQNCSPIDQSFGVGGRAIGINENNYHYTKNIIAQPDNKIIQFSSGGVGTGGEHFKVLRYNENGTIDNSFGQNGKVVTAIGQYDQAAFGLLQHDGKIVIAGNSSGPNYSTDMAMVRYNSNGTLDNSFGVGGKVLSSFSPNNDRVNGVAIQTDGKIIVVGSIDGGNCFTDCWGSWFCTPLFSVIRYNTNGSIDSSFGQNGKVTTNVGPANAGSAQSVVVQPDGKILVGGMSLYDYTCDYYGGWYASSRFTMVRYHPNGTLDTLFGDKGMVSDFSDLVNTSGLTLQGDRIVVVGTYHPTYRFVTKRYNSDGSLDNNFGQQGKVDMGDGYVNTMIGLPNGKIATAGYVYKNSQGHFQIIRLNSDGSFDSTFGGSGVLAIHTGSPGSYDVATGVALQGDHLIAGGTSYYNPNHSVLVVRLVDSLVNLPVAIRSTGTLFPCPGESVRLVANESGTIRWFNNGSVINGATDTVLTTFASGQYTVMVQNSKGCGESAPVTVTVNGLPVTIVAGSSLGFCEGDSVRLMSSERGTLQWSKNGVVISGATDTVYTAKTSGAYTVAVKNAKGCGVSSPAIVTVAQGKPVVYWDAAQSRLSTVAGYYSYQWYLDGNSIAGANANYFSPVQTGVYRVTILDYRCEKTSDEFRLDCNLAGVSKPPVTWNGAQLNTAAGYTQYQWYLNGVPIAGAYGSFFQPVQVGAYKVTVTNTVGCSNTSDEFNLSCNALGVPKPPINWTSTYYFSTTAGYAHYQWNLNGSPIAGHDSSSYKPVEIGIYSVTVSNGAGCSNTSDNFQLVILGVADITVGDSKLRYYPNPARAVLNVDIATTGRGKLEAEIYDLPGRLVQKQLLNQRHNQLLIGRLPAGLYQLVIFNGTEKTAVKVMVIK